MGLGGTTLVLGIETSCDECSVAIVEEGRRIVGQIIDTQYAQHEPYAGVVPEIASRTHTRWISTVCARALDHAGVAIDEIDAVAATARPGLIGSLVVGLSFAKGISLATGIPLIAVNHVLAHMYAVQLEREVEYPFLVLLVSGGHTLIARADSPFEVEVLGATIDDACGEAFDKVAKHLGLGYPGGVQIDRVARLGDYRAFRFPLATLHKGEHRFDVSYSGLKTAVVNQLDQFWDRSYEKSTANIAASFQYAAIEMVLRRLRRASSDTGIARAVIAGGVAANSHLRRRLAETSELEVYIPSPSLCTDNGAMIAGLGYHQLLSGQTAELDAEVASRVREFKRNYP